MKQILQSIQSAISSLRKDGKEPQPSVSSINWFSKKVNSLKSITKGQINPKQANIGKQILQQTEKASKTFKYKKSGYIYFFNYIPPDKKNYNFYDSFPLVLSLGFTRNQMIGVNLHYLPIKVRLFVIYKLIKSLMINPKEGARIRVQSLFTSRTIREYISLLSEQYHYAGIKSKIKLVGPTEFMTMAFLRVQKFNKSPESQALDKVKKAYNLKQRKKK